MLDRIETSVECLPFQDEISVPKLAKKCHVFHLYRLRHATVLLLFPNKLAWVQGGRVDVPWLQGAFCIDGDRTSSFFSRANCMIFQNSAKFCCILEVGLRSSLLSWLWQNATICSAQGQQCCEITMTLSDPRLSCLCKLKPLAAHNWMSVMDVFHCIASINQCSCKGADWMWKTTLAYCDAWFCRL